MSSASSIRSLTSRPRSLHPTPASDSGACRPRRRSCSSPGRALTTRAAGRPVARAPPGSSSGAGSGSRICIGGGRSIGGGIRPSRASTPRSATPLAMERQTSFTTTSRDPADAGRTTLSRSETESAGRCSARTRASPGSELTPAHWPSTSPSVRALSRVARPIASAAPATSVCAGRAPDWWRRPRE